MAQDGYWNTFHQENLLFVWVRRVECRIHPESLEAIVVVATDDEEGWDVTLGVFGWECELQCHLETNRSRLSSRQVHVSSQHLLLRSQFLPFALIIPIFNEILTPLVSLWVSHGLLEEWAAFH